MATIEQQIEPHPTQCRLDVRVRYAECDPMGYLHHAKYFEYFEMARTELLRATGIRYRDMEDKGFLFVVVRTECRFLRPARYDDTLTIEVRLERMTRARIDHAYKIYRDGFVLCEALTTLACVNREGRPIPIPSEISHCED
ncbi:MAG: acyl-CoA thioesterase [Phycisphaerales bacterium]|nr:acyl-CoA thioesterase [Phycisphaerales bacterium]